MEWYYQLLILLFGFVAGYINTLSGSGSLLTLPLLIFLGLPANVANGTNRISILFQTLVSTASFRNQQILEWKKGIRIAIPALLGSMVGAFIAVDLKESVMNNAIAVLLIAMLILIAIKPEKWFRRKPQEVAQMRVWHYAGMFLIGIYGGFIQAGVGLFLLAILVMGFGMDVVVANAYKNFVVLCFTVFALLVFIYHQQVEYLPGLLLAAGSMGGAWLASRMAVKKGPALISWFVLAMILVSALQLLGFFKWITEA